MSGPYRTGERHESANALNGFSEHRAGQLMTNYLALPTGEGAPAEVNAVIEIPRGQTNKYE